GEVGGDEAKDVAFLEGEVLGDEVRAVAEAFGEFEDPLALVLRDPGFLAEHPRHGGRGGVRHLGNVLDCDRHFFPREAVLGTRFATWLTWSKGIGRAQRRDSRAAVAIKGHPPPLEWSKRWL